MLIDGKNDKKTVSSFSRLCRLLTWHFAEVPFSQCALLLPNGSELVMAAEHGLQTWEVVAGLGFRV